MTGVPESAGWGGVSSSPHTAKSRLPASRSPNNSALKPTCNWTCAAGRSTMKRGSSDWLTSRATTCPAPTRTLPTLPAASWATSRSASSSVTRALSARARSAAPIGVSSTPRGARTNNCAPKCASSRCRLRVSAGWLMPSASGGAREVARFADGEEVLEFPVQQRHARKLSHMCVFVIGAHVPVTHNPRFCGRVATAIRGTSRARCADHRELRNGIAAVHRGAYDSPRPERSRRAIDCGAGEFRWADDGIAGRKMRACREVTLDARSQGMSDSRSAGPRGVAAPC